MFKNPLGKTSNHCHFSLETPKLPEASQMCVGGCYSTQFWQSKWARGKLLLLEVCKLIRVIFTELG